nr:S-methyl-5-thioribose-1-phosphate isomerase [Candidatus Frankia alpina]
MGIGYRPIMVDVGGPELRPLVWTGSSLRLLDQTALPEALVHLEVDDPDELVAAIRRLAVRGAPALGVAGAFGVALALRSAEREGWETARLDAALHRLRAARPTALALAAGVDAAARRIPAGMPAVLAVAERLAVEDETANRAIGRHGADGVLARTTRRPLRVLTHCNTGSLATAGWGTALGVIRELHARGAVEVVHVDETRPLLQSSRLTAWELARAGIDCRVQADSAAAGAILRGLVDVALVGADRIAANGDVANKVGTVGIALACAYADIPFVVAASRSTIDPGTPSGADIPIEERDGAEVLSLAGRATAPPGVRGFNPAFDVTPAHLVSLLVTEDGTEPGGPISTVTSAS